MSCENAWLLGEIVENAPAHRPGFMSAMAVSWNYFPSWLKDLQMRLPDDFVLVSPHELNRLYRIHEELSRSEGKER